MKPTDRFTNLLRANLNAVLRSQIDLLPKHAHLLIAVSGGQDSLCLAKLLLMKQAKFNWRLTIAHCDHRWRDDSQANAEHVEQLAKIWGVNFCLRTTETKLTSEAMAREWRYRMLVEMAQVQQASYVVTGHTRSDRTETLLYNLMRGSGADGLASLTWWRSLTDEIKLVRPLLNVSRAETLGFCQEQQIPIWKDSTNQNLDYRRNRLRLETIPYLQQHFNPQLEIAIAKTAELLHDDVMYLESQASRFFEEGISVFWDDHAPCLHRQLLQAQPLALQRRIVRHFLSKYLPHQVNFEDIERFLKLLTEQNRAQSSPFKGNISAFIDHPWIILKI
ncbi:tRNA lysidine(34) synthetase TilS [Pseudanabaena mucicola]|uniref:tRNA(Ile)-lysidine synthase n=1 Tax=Pseudanabaena mucicola FACHB-723 TaxID=2692860 RepID=A0ABR7ZWE8_9CYAN|nr:tRNA lysidine(34) synthetase TilS [Pseudanabaena mucicola]MBD2187854.1 tRNA lysidine(34) synthetase TilS [Pseudanabaena mucicola FACHB-723]